MVLFDSHAHLDSQKYDASIGELINSEELLWVLTVGTDLETSLRAVNIAESYHKAWAAVGVHPHFAESYSDYIHEKVKISAYNPHVLAIGEIGLDYYRMNSPKDDQLKTFRRQINIAKQLGLPIIVHIRDALDDAVKVLEQEEAHTVGGILHSFPGDLETAKKMVENNFLIGLNGIITFKKFDRERLVEELPLENIVIETDCPYLTPRPHRGKVNTPRHVKYVAQRIAELKDEQVEEVAESTTYNTSQLLKIPFVKESPQVFHQKEQLSQVFLKERHYLKKVASLVSSDTNILEIGPGKGNLTDLLADNANEIVAVEYDINLSEDLYNSDWQNVQVINRDFLEVNLKHLFKYFQGGEFEIVGNLPYHITNPIVMKLMKARDYFSKAVIMLQKQVGKKLIAGSGDKHYGITSVLTQLSFKVKKQFTVPAGAFSPSPEVDSIVLTLRPRHYETEPNWELLRKVVRGAFNKKRKTAANSLQNNPFINLPKPSINEIFSELDIPPKVRAENISPEKFVEVADLLERN